jgi:hypothetical protein
MKEKVKMKKRFSEEQIVRILGEQKTGKKVLDITRENGSVKIRSIFGSASMGI